MRNALAVPALCLYVACARGVYQPVEPHGDRVVQALWTHHRAVILVTTGDPAAEVDVRQFGQAIRFFVTTTGIASDTGSWAGHLPTAGLSKTLRQWDQWYAEHRTSLYFDAESCQVRAR